MVGDSSIHPGLKRKLGRFLQQQGLQNTPQTPFTPERTYSQLPGVHTNLAREREMFE
jgi:hypothetical protein